MSENIMRKFMHAAEDYVRKFFNPYKYSSRVDFIAGAAYGYKLAKEEAMQQCAIRSYIEAEELK
jgi:hypothetical protein